MKKKVLVIGSAILDVLVYPASEEVFRTGSWAAEDIRMSFGGDALNEASVLSGIGAKVELLTVLGRDQAGEMIRNHCRDRGIELKPACIRENLNTGINVVLVKENGERCFLTNPNGGLRKLTAEDITIPFSQDVGILSFASIFVHPHIQAEELEHIFKEAKAQGITVCADMTKCKNGETLADIAPALAYVDYLFANEEEAMLITGRKDAHMAADDFLKVGVKHIVVKRGAKGCLMKSQKERLEIPPHTGVKCVDTTGAGDSFAAGFIYALSKRCSFAECGAYANQCGAKAVEQVGATDWVWL